jgi:signal peptide peptidase SppA
MRTAKKIFFALVAGLLIPHAPSCYSNDNNFELKITLPNADLVYGAAKLAALAAAGYLVYKICPRIYDYVKPSVKVASIYFDEPIRETNELVAKLMYVNETDSIEALLFIVDSGGGAPGQSELLYHLVDSIAAKKPVVVLTIDACASGAYLMVSPATAIVSLGMSSVGCIGVTGTRAKISPEKFDDEGTSGTIEVFPFSAGKYKSLQNEHAPMTDEIKERVQYEMDAIYDVFINLVAYARELKVEEKETWADGKVFTGWEARNLGLVDEVGGIDTALTVLKNILRDAGKNADNLQFIKL